jgi:prepilin-type N-terminal cleavage/methylation domain-containing protein
MCHASCPRSGFTFVELVIVIAILVALMAAVIAVWSMVRARTAISSTHSLVIGVATQIATYGARPWQWQDPIGVQKSGPLFDLNNDGLIDGRPGVVASDDIDGGFSPAVIASGYRGFAAMTGVNPGKTSLANNQQPLDAWKHPLRIAHAAKIYGTGSFGIWSAGPDGIDGTPDDVCSWPNSP